jgi:hypothetical protein
MRARRAEFAAPAPVVALAKQIALCRGGALCDFAGDRPALHTLPPGPYDRLVGVVRALDAVVLASSARRGHALFGLAAGTLRAVPRGLQETCAAVVGGEFVVVGGADGTVAVFGVTAERRIARSTFHANAVVAVGACLDLGLVVSVDARAVAVFETLFDCTLINVVTIEGLVGVPIVRVFKSGIVAVSNAAEVVLYDCRGKVVGRFAVDGGVVSMEKYYDVGAREILLVSYETEFVNLYDLTTFTRLQTFNTPFLHPIVCPVKKSRAFLVAGQGKKVQRIDFADMLPTVFGRSP